MWYLDQKKMQNLDVRISEVTGKEAVCAQCNSYCVDEVRLFCVQSGMCWDPDIVTYFFSLLHKLIEMVAGFLLIAMQKDDDSFLL